MILHRGTLDRWHEKGLVSEKARKLLGALSSGESRSVEQLIDAVYPNPDNSPLGAENCIRQLIFQTQKRLEGRVNIRPTHAYTMTLGETQIGTEEEMFKVNTPLNESNLD